MKSPQIKPVKIILVLGFSLACLISTLYAGLGHGPFGGSKTPGLPLPAAYHRALAALGAGTNQFHCVSARITADFRPEGEWYFTFHSTNPDIAPKFIAVEFNGAVIFDSAQR